MLRLGGFELSSRWVPLIIPLKDGKKLNVLVS